MKLNTVIEKMGRMLRKCASVGIPTLQFWNAQRCTMPCIYSWNIRP